jgi:hypothetical protein
MSTSAARAAGLALRSFAVSQAATSHRKHVYDGVGNPNDAASFSCQKLD